MITTEFPPQPGGIGNHAFNLAQSLSDTGFQLNVLTNTRSNSGEEEKNFDAKLSFLVKRIKRHNAILLTFTNRITTAIHLTNKQDYIIVSGKFSLWLGDLISFVLSKKIIAIVHGSELNLHNSLARKFIEKSLNKCEQIIAVSTFTKSLLPKSLQRKTVVIPNGFSINGLDLMPNQCNNKILKLITVGNVTSRKGQHNVINAIPLLLNTWPLMQYHIVGIPTNKEKLLLLAKELNIEKSIFFHGKVSEAEKIDLLKEASIFLMLSENTLAGDVEGFGIAILEANALGIPAIGSKGCGIEDAISPNLSGILIDPKDGSQLVKAIKEILLNYKCYSDNATIWSENFTWEVIVKKYIAILKSL